MKKKSMLLGTVSFFGTVMVLLLAYWVFTLNYFLVQINGTSMTPYFQNGDTAIFKKVDRIENGEIVVFSLPKAWKKVWKGEANPRLIKRIALKPGDTLAWDGNNWYANGKQFSYVKTGSCEVPPVEVILSSNQIFVTGDATDSKTLDSREAFCLGLDYFVTLDNILEVGELEKIL